VSAPRGRRLVGGTWKMNLGEAAAEALVAALVRTLPFDRVDAAVAPAFPCLRRALDAAAGSPLAIAAQNVHDRDSGAFTGEVAAGMLREMGVRYVIVGHSERRRLFGESEMLIGRKVVACRRHGLTPIVCLGETEEQRDAGLTQDVVAAQAAAALGAAPFPPGADLVVAYEPVWAIGTGRTPSPADVAAAHGTIRRTLASRFGADADRVPILYGGSVTPANAPQIFEAEDVSGALVGGASLEASSFLGIVEAAA